ncbi:receptor-type tyrosine-protein phosphatase kappa-like protein [Leptotrombidium deliense]|uniref:Receptor-type tyrosine-protein phosphatase kappa-like protein n=1 Tax=Leptotrombidium deliense TaxID=299467 RepID=A0A443SC13_9ACAR|nr:receptor-type tyrosine-protein phosphatase kappa-like protein [Leptotrombidium deliense]
MQTLRKLFSTVAAKGEPHTFRHAVKEANEPKNCNKKLVPYDYNRVVLEAIPDVAESDYINASYIDSILKPNAYIATQGPNDETIGDFWRMVWEQNSYIIVMLTKVFDFIRTMCSQYWPPDIDKPHVYGLMEVTLLTDEPLSDFSVRTFRIRKINKSKQDEESSEIEEGRVVHQFHYHEWQIHSSPYPNSLLNFRRRVRIKTKESHAQHGSTGPVIVHCSDGCGRTGVYLCIDANLELSHEDNVVDVFGYTKKMRNSRKGMIETVDQYKFIYECLEEAFINGKTWFSLNELSQQMKYKSMKNSITQLNEYQNEYQKILKMTSRFSIGDCAGGHRIENRDKNRDVANVPPDNYRPYLTTFQSNDSTDYVNGVFVDGYTRSREYIVTEWPMPHTVADCWSLIYDHDCNSVVVLASPDDSNVSSKYKCLPKFTLSKTYPAFWPTEKEKRKKFGPVFTVELISFNHYPNIKSWIFRINKKVVSLTELMSGVKGVPKTTQFFQVTCWPLGHKVPSSTNALVELMNMVERWRQRSTHGPVCIVSTNGQSRAGVYCAANVAIEQVIKYGEIDVFSAVKTVRKNRPQLVENMTEYKYCYDLISHYVLNYLETPQL